MKPAMMRSAIVVVILAAAAVGGEGISGRRSLMSKRIVVADCSKRQACADCYSVKICSYDKIVLAQYRCMDVDPSKPYCIGDGECSAQSDSPDDCKKSDDLCLLGDPGYYPDPTNCTRYLYCDDNAVSFPQSCLASNNVYNQTSASCFLKKRTADCFQVDCTNTRNKDKWFIYEPFQQLYFLCSQNGPVLFKCERTTDVYDVNTRRCEFKCPRAGRFAYPNDPNMYYECVDVSTAKVEKFVQKCPMLLVFDPESEKCVPAENTQD